MAVEQNREGKSSLPQFIANRGNKAVEEAIELAKEFAEAEAKCLRAKKTRIELLQEQTTGECVHGRGGRWFEAAQQLLQRYKTRFLYRNLRRFEQGKRKVQKYLYLWRHKLRQLVHLSSVKGHL